MSDEELLKCISDDRVMVPSSLMSIEDMGDMIEDMEDMYEKNKRKGLSRSVIASFDAKKKAIETELNRRGLKWRRYSDEERDCLWSLQHLLFGDAPPTAKAVKEFWELVSANGGRVLCHRFSPCEHHIAGLKLRLEAIGLLAEWTLDDTGNVWVDVKGPQGVLTAETVGDKLR
jgi:hypothetical protein